MPARLVQVVMDAADPLGLARFWSAALGWPIVLEEPDEVVIEPPEDDPAQRGQLPLIFVPAAGVKTRKNRVHLDLASVSVGHQAALVARLEELGARRLDIGQGAVSWVVMADPEGNELCVVSHRGSVGEDPASAFAGIGPVAAVVFDCADPEGIAPFWVAATGWAALGQDDQGVWLRDVTAGGPYLDLHRVSEPKQGASCASTSASHPSPTTITPPRSSACAPSAHGQRTPVTPTSAGSSSPTPKATSSASPPHADAGP
jgi:hypothetical protein